MADHDEGGSPSVLGIFEIVILLLVAFFVVTLFVPDFGINSIGTPDSIILFFYKIFLAVLPFVVTAFLGYIAFKIWLHYIQQDFISGIDFVLLEIIPPREVARSPKAMELFISNALYHFSNKGGREEYWQGAVWLWFSLEIVSIEGLRWAR